MAVNFVQQKKKQKYLLYVVVIVIVITMVLLWLGYFRESEVFPIIEEGIQTSTVSRITIDLEVLKNPFIKKLEPFEGISDFEGQKGRANPFLPY